MPDYHPMAELAPRDIVSRAIVTEMKKTGVDHVFLDLTSRGPTFIENRFPTITATLIKFGIHPGKYLIPVAPAAHYFCGGVHTDIDGRTTIQGLYAGGEVACTGVHGANRLASNSLLESVVFAYRAAVNADRQIRYLPSNWWDKLKPLLDQPESRSINNQPCDADLDEIRKNVQEINWQHCGIIRTDRGLRKGLEKIGEIDRYFESINGYVCNRLKAVALANLIKLSESVYKAAIARRTNAGTHFNSDCVSKHA